MTDPGTGKGGPILRPWIVGVAVVVAFSGSMAATEPGKGFVQVPRADEIAAWVDGPVATSQPESQQPTSTVADVASTSTVANEEGDEVGDEGVLSGLWRSNGWGMDQVNAAAAFFPRPADLECERSKGHEWFDISCSGPRWHVNLTVGPDALHLPESDRYWMISGSDERVGGLQTRIDSDSLATLVWTYDEFAASGEMVATTPDVKEDDLIAAWRKFEMLPIHGQDIWTIMSGENGWLFANSATSFFTAPDSVDLAVTCEPSGDASISCVSDVFEWTYTVAGEIDEFGTPTREWGYGSEGELTSVLGSMWDTDEGALVWAYDDETRAVGVLAHVEGTGPVGDLVPFWQGLNVDPPPPLLPSD